MRKIVSSSVLLLFVFALGVLDINRANAATLTFDGIPGYGVYLFPYSESGYTLSMISSGGNPPTGTNPHYGDANGAGPHVGAFSWHDTGSNGTDAIVRLTRNDNANFSFTSFDMGGFTHVDTNGAYYVSAPGYGPNNYSTIGTKLVNYNNVAYVDFGFTILGGGVSMDNLVVSAVPIPAALPLLLSALGVFGFMGWRRKNAAA